MSLTVMLKVISGKMHLALNSGKVYLRVNVDKNFALEHTNFKIHIE